ncbi:MAG: stage V sporulation protein AD [Oscillospiraceae bacterium]|jgi:stage V sporulation protein AD|nr:stage V sporulation protein AD [Oscillospiraceae bacterium]
MPKQRGKQTVALASPVAVASSACAAGKKEGLGPLRHSIDSIYENSLQGMKSWEQAESAMQRDALNLALSKGNFPETSIQYLLAGDLLGQCIGSVFAARDCEIPFIGLYGACSTMAESLGLGSMLIDGGFADRVAVVTSSHFCGSERQFRLPLEYGGQRTPTAQWTVTGAGAAVLERSAVSGNPNHPRISHVTFGKVTDMGIKDVTNMGAAMAPAAFSTLTAHFEDCKLAPEDYDLIVTGDLGSVGSDILRDLFMKKGVSLGERYTDCGLLIFNRDDADAGAGGSGCGCSAVALCGYILSGMRENKWRRVLFCGTGALFSPVSAQQGESIPSVCHAVRLIGGNGSCNT